jgi:hypothetical protein
MFHYKVTKKIIFWERISNSAASLVKYISIILHQEENYIPVGRRVLGQF